MSGGRSSSHGPTDGVVARGKIRVDARRAVEKLREHLLVDLHLYTLEIARAAVLGGASMIDVEHDADDVKITFDGESLDEGTLTRLLDHVLVEAITKDARRNRLLATGLNAALGLSPAYVDVLSPAPMSAKEAHGKARSCLRVRWTPELLAPKAEGEPAEAPKCDRVAAPKGMPERGVRIEVRRRVGWGVVRQAITGGVPSEVALLAGATFEIGLPMTLASKPFPRPNRARALVRAPFSVRGVKKAAVEIITPLVAHPEIELLEQGVCLTRYAWSFGEWFPSEPLDKVALPIRVIVDADELPTNASRSEIQRDAPLISLVAQAARHAFDDALATLISAVTSRGEAAPGTEILTDDKRALEDALGALACVAAKSARSGAALRDKAKALLDEALLFDGLGRPLAPSALLERAPSRVYVWRGSEPLPPELEPWTGNVMWHRGRLAERIFELHDVADAKEIVEQAKIGAARRKALLAHAAAEPVVPPLEDEIFRASFDQKQGDFKGLRGEVVVVAESAERPGTVARVFVDGRNLDTITFDAETIPLRLEIALAWEGRVRARYTYDGVEREQPLLMAIWHATRAAVLAADQAALKLGDAVPSPPMRAALRAAIATHFAQTDRLGFKLPPPDVPLSYLRGLHRARIWPTTEADRFESIQSLAASMEKAGALCVARPDAAGKAADGRPVVAAKDREIEWLTAALAPKPVFVKYTTWLLSPQEIEQREARRYSVLRAALDEEGADTSVLADINWPSFIALAAAGSAPKLSLLHAGRRVHGAALTPTLGPAVVVVDDDAWMPSENPSTSIPPAVIGYIAGIERQLCERVVASLEESAAREAGKPAAQGNPIRMSHALRAYLIDSAQKLRARVKEASKAEDTALLDRIRALPLLVSLDAGGAPIAASLASLEGAHPAPAAIPFLSRAPGFETLSWRPVIITREDPVFPAFARWADGRAIAGEPSIPARMAQAALEAKRRALVARTPLDISSAGDLAESDAKVARISWMTHALPPGVVITAALPKAQITPPASMAPFGTVSGVTLEHAIIDLLYDARPVARLALRSLRIPVVARVSVTNEAYFVGWEELSEKGASMIAEHVRVAAQALAEELLKAATGAAKGDLFVGDLRALRFIHALLVSSPIPEASIINHLRSQDFLWPTVQGERLPFDAMRVTTGSSGPELCVGSDRHVPWLGPARGKADLDAPILHIAETPEGAVIKLILQAMGVKCRSVTEALSKLQARRAAARPNEAPTLAGAPPHPELRMSLGQGQLQTAEGELEIIEGPTSEVRIIGLDGAQVTVTEGIPFPLRVVARVESVDLRPEMTRVLMKEISRVAVRRALSLSQKLDEMPLFVRDHVRNIVCKAVASRSKIGVRQKDASVFLDINNNWHALSELKLEPGDPVLYTTDPPPYPKRKPGEPVLRLNKEEADALALLGKLKDITANLRRDRIAEERSGAPPVSAIRLDPELASKCVRVIPLSEGGAVGEIGVLAPQHQSKRGINLFVTGRPLCVIDDGEGWGLCAAVNDDSIKPNRWFDGVKSSTSSQEVTRLVREVATRAMRSWLAPPEDALAVRWIDAPPSMTGDKTLPIVGAIWLPSAWPEGPSVRVLLELGSEPKNRPVIAPGAVTVIRRHVPICGDIFAAGEVVWAAVERVLLREAELMIAALEPTPETRDAIAAYQWNMGLLGFTSSTVPKARTSEGGEVGLAEVMGELAGRGCVWVTRREGSADGSFPEAPPPFILLDNTPTRPPPLLTVLRGRAPREAVRELGAPPASSVIDPSESSVFVTPPATRPLYFADIVIPRVDALGSISSAAAAPAAPPAPALPWLERLRRRVALLFTSKKAPADLALPEQNALCAALHQALGELGLVGGPVHEIIETKRGPAVRYDEENKRVLLNRQHRSLRWLRSSDAPSARDLSFLIAAIVSEINRALTGVTDAEERRVLLQLLRTGLDAPPSAAK